MIRVVEPVKVWMCCGNKPVLRLRGIRHLTSRFRSCNVDKDKLFRLADFSYAPETDFLSDINHKASLYCELNNDTAKGKIFKYPLKLWRNGIVNSSNQFQFLSKMNFSSNDNLKDLFKSKPGLLQDLVYLKSLQEISENLCWESEVDYSITSCFFELDGNELSKESFIKSIGINSALVEAKDGLADVHCEVIKSEKRVEEILLSNTKFHYSEYETSPRPLEAICCLTLATLLIQLEKVHYICIGKERMNPLLIFLIGMTEHGRAVGLITGSVET